MTQVIHFYIFTQENESICLHKDWYVNVATSFVIFVTAPDWKQLKWPIKKWIHKQIVVHPYNGVLLNNKKEWTVPTCNSRDEFQSKQLHWVKEARQKSIYCMIPLT